LRSRIFLAALLAASMPHGVLAQPRSDDPAAPVPALPYPPVFASPQPLPTDTGVNLADWVRANADVGRQMHGDSDILPSEADSAAPGKVVQTSPAAAPLTPAQAVALALRHLPGLMAPPQANALARAQIDARVRALTDSVQRAWIDAVAGRQAEAHLRQVAQAAQTGVELGQRMVRVGHWSRMQLLQQQRVLSAAVEQLALAQQTSFSATENLVRLMGVWGSAAQLTLPAQMPELPATLLDTPDLEALALRHQPELALARIEARQATAGVTESQLAQWQLAIDAALQDASRPADTALTTFGQPSAAPVLDPRQVPLTHALARAVQARSLAHTLAVNTRSQAREAYFRYRTAIDRVQHQREAALLAAALQEETQLRYNGMLQSTWELLASATTRLQSEVAVSQAQRDAWLAYLDLQAVLSGAVVNFSSTPSAAGTAPAANPGH